jgi:branched-chain amino acid transport system ATP-binding protein
LLAAGICYVPQGRNIFPELSVRHNIELGASAAGRDIGDLPARIEAALDRFPVLRNKATQQASTLSGGEQKQLEIVRGLLLNPQLVLIDEPSIGLSPLMVRPDSPRRQGGAGSQRPTHRRTVSRRCDEGFSFR